MSNGNRGLSPVVACCCVPCCCPNSGLENSACLGMKNIGKQCAGQLQARFDEGGLSQGCSLLYPSVTKSVLFLRPILDRPRISQMV